MGCLSDKLLFIEKALVMNEGMNHRKSLN